MQVLVGGASVPMVSLEDHNSFLSLCSSLLLLYLGCFLLKPLSDSVWDAKIFGVGFFFLVFFPQNQSFQFSKWLNFLVVKMFWMKEMLLVSN